MSRFKRIVLSLCLMYLCSIDAFSSNNNNIYNNKLAFYSNQAVNNIKWRSLVSPAAVSREHLLRLPASISTEDINIIEKTTTTTTTNDDANEELNESAVQDLNRRSNVERFINACILMAAFGYALYTILDVDHGMTRGWTNQEIMMRLPYDNWRNYENSLVDSPVATKTVINVIIYLLGDWLSQTVFQKQFILDFDPIRTFKNGFIGACFGPLVHEYYEFSDRILPVEVGINRLYKIFMDQTIYLGIKCSIYIAAVGLLNGQSIEEVTESVKSRIANVMFTAWKFWPFVHCVTYGLIPAQHRVLWVNCVDLVWNAILAALATGKENEQEVVVEEGDDHVSILNVTHHIDELSEKMEHKYDFAILNEKDGLHIHKKLELEFNLEDDNDPALVDALSVVPKEDPSIRISNSTVAFVDSE